MTKPRLAIEQPDGSRKYIHPMTGEAVYSVTTIIDAGIPKPWLGPWAAKMAAEHAIKHWERLENMPVYERIYEMKNAHKVYAEEKADIGDIVHDLVDAWSTGRPAETHVRGINVNGYVNQFIDFLTVKRPRFIENEVTLFSRMHGYAGTADFIIEMDNRVWLADLKTGKNLHDEIGLQLAALGHCDFILREDGTEDPVPEVYGYLGLHLRPRSWKLARVGESEACFEAFLAAQSIMRWTTEIAPKVL